MVQIRWTRLAVEDLKGIYEYIAKDSTKYAKIQVIRLRSRTHLLKSFPLSGTTVPEYNDPRFRELIEGNYRIIYKIVDDARVDILTVHHSARDLGRRQIE